MRLIRNGKIQAALVLGACWVLLALIGCAEREVKTAEPAIEEMPGSRLYITAEKHFQIQDYDKALVLYTSYVAMYPNSPLSPPSLLKIGAIHTAKGEYDKAREAYRKMIDGYPQSHLLSDARMGILLSYYQEGRFEQVIEGGDSIKDDGATPELMFRKYALIGDAFLALGRTVEAFNAYMKMYAVAEDAQKENALKKIEPVLPYLSVEDIRSLLEQTEDPQLRALFMFGLGVQYQSQDQPETAMAVLSRFMEEFPDDPRVPEAEAMIAAMQAGAEYQHYTIGALLPLSGRYEAFGSKALKGVELALSKFSLEHPEVPISLTIKDTASDPQIALQGAKALADENVAAIIGPIMSAPEAVRYVQDHKIPIILLTQKEHVTDIGDYVFRNFLTPAMQVETLVSYAVNELEAKRFAILYPDEKYGITFMNLFWDEVLKHDGEVVGVESYAPDAVDFSDAIKRLVGLYYDFPDELKSPPPPPPVEEEVMAPPPLEDEENVETDEDEEPQAIVDFDAIFLPDGPDKAGLILPQLTYFDLVNVYLLGTNLWHSQRLIQMAGRHAQGAIMTEIFFADSTNPVVQDFVNQFEATYQEKPSFIEAFAYDTADILFQIVSRPDVRFRSSIRLHLANLKDFPGVTGSTSFRPNGEASKSLYVLKISGNTFRELERY